MTSLICTALYIYLFVIFARILLSWFPLDPNGIGAAIAGFLYVLTDPILVPLRKLIPGVRLGRVMLDLSPIIAIIGIQILLSIIC